MRRFILLNFLFISIFLASCSCTGTGNEAENILSEEYFKNPPSWAKPRTWMHAMSGNMTKEGMTKDLEAISEVGIGGILLFNIAQGIPYGPITYNSHEHHEILKHTAKECERLGLSFGFHNCAGWSSSGGPWITPEESMKMLVYSQIVVDGGAINVNLPQPTIRENFYKDIAVLAYPALRADIVDFENKPKISSSDNNFNIEVACDGQIAATTKLNESKNGDTFVLFDYGTQIPISSVFISTTDRNGKVSLWTSDNGIEYTKRIELTQVRVGKGEWCFLDSFESLNARYYKLVSEGPLNIKEIKFSASAWIDDYLSKNCMGRKDDRNIRLTRIISDNMVINKDHIIDITANLSGNGNLVTTLPKGKWTIMRIGYTSTGAFNHPASESGRGLECDKFDSKAIEKHFAAFSQKVIDNVKNVAPNALQYIEVDSYEMGGQNWTADFEHLFKEKKGYDIRPFLPLILGKYMENTETIEAVMSDFREMCCDLMNTNYFKRFVELCHDNGLKCYVEPYGNGPFDHLEVGGVCDIPMGEFWMNRTSSIVRSAVSSAHIYGKNVVSAESFTSQPEINWKGHPGMAKASGDMVWKEGVNEFMFHRFAHQPNIHVRPGMTMNRWGFHFDRTQTWWNNAGKAWFKYMSRGSYMLRLGVPVTDVLVFVGDGSPSSSPGIKFDGLKTDAVNSDVLCNRVFVRNGKMVLPEGTTYQILYLDNCRSLSINTLRRICELAESGVPIIGNLPVKISGYLNINKSLDEMNELVSRIRKCANYYHKGEEKELLKKEHIINDFEVTEPSDIYMNYAHRHLEDGTEIYFISNTDSIKRNFVCNFRVSGKLPELWKAMDGSMSEADVYEMKDNGQTMVEIELEGYESVFVVFRNPVVEKKRSIHYVYNELEIQDLNTDWNVEFLKEYGYDDTIHFDKLIDWSLSKNEEVCYYSGTAIYRKKIDVSEEILKNSSKAVLDLGEVNISSEIIVNGKNVAILWMTPYKVDIYEYLKSGLNDIELRITNQWTNRLIGDERYPKQDGGYVLEGQFPKGKMPEWYVVNKPMPEGPRMTFCTGQFYRKDDPLISAGLVGPACISFIDHEKMN